jgi:hypothetical protein
LLPLLTAGYGTNTTNRNVRSDDRFGAILLQKSATGQRGCWLDFLGTVLTIRFFWSGDAASNGADT